MREKIAIYPGSFDPLTNGHLDILSRALKIFDQIIVAVTESEHKKPLFTVEERVSMLKKATESMKNVQAESFSGLLVRKVQEKNAIAIIRGLRAVSDFEYEFQMATINRRMYHELQTVFLMASEKFFFVNSTIVKEVFGHGGKVSEWVPSHVEKELKKTL